MNYIAHVHGQKTGGYIVAARSKAGLIAKAKAEVRREAEGALLSAPNGIPFGEILLRGENRKPVYRAI